MSTLDRLDITSTGSVSANLPHWPYIDATGTCVAIPEVECDLTSLHLRSRPEADSAVRAIQAGIGLTIGQIARSLGCSRQAVHGWMRGNRVEATNLANLKALSSMAVQWKTSNPRRHIDPDLLDAAFLEKLARLGASTSKARQLWETRILRPTPETTRWEDLPTADEIAKKIGALPVSEKERAHRRAHNLGALKIDARL